MTVATPNQDYLAFEAAMKARDPRWYESSPACIGYMAWCASRDSAPPPAGGERKPAAQQEPLFWYRPRSDGLYEGPIHNAQIERARKESGGWVPLYTQAGERKPLTMPAGVAEAYTALEEMAKMEPSRPSMQCVSLVFDWLRSNGITATKGER